MALRCPHCNSGLSRVNNTYRYYYNNKGKRFEGIKRNRQCHHCKRYWITYEKNAVDIIKESIEDTRIPEPKLPENPYLPGQLGDLTKKPEEPPSPFRKPKRKEEGKTENLPNPFIQAEPKKE